MIMCSSISENQRKMCRRSRRRPRKWPIWQPGKPRKRKSWRNRRIKKRLKKWRSKAMRPRPNCRVSVKRAIWRGTCITSIATTLAIRVHTLIWPSSMCTIKSAFTKTRMRSATIRRTKKKRRETPTMNSVKRMMRKTQATTRTNRASSNHWTPSKKERKEER